MPANEDLIRSNLCANDKTNALHFLTSGLSNEAAICDILVPENDKGNGEVACPQNNANGSRGMDEQLYHKWSYGSGPPG